MPPLTHSEIEQLLPHRFPFLFVDTVDDYELGVRILGRKRFTGADFLMQSGEGFVPESILTEAAAQVGAILILKDPAHARKLPYFMGIDSIAFHQRVRVGETIQFEVRIEKMRGAFGILSGRAWVNETLVAEATMRVALADRIAAEDNREA